MSGIDSAPMGGWSCSVGCVLLAERRWRRGLKDACGLVTKRGGAAVPRPAAVGLILGEADVWGTEPQP